MKDRKSCKIAKMGRIKTKLVGIFSVYASLLVVASAAYGQTPFSPPPGYDLFETDPQNTKLTFDGPTTIPAGFFGPGSDPFTGSVKFAGEPIENFQGHDVGDADTVVQRLPVESPAQSFVSVELVSLSLVSVEPIHVRVGNETQEWNVDVELSPSKHSQGYLQAEQTGPNGGTFSSQLLVVPLLKFKNVSSGETRTLDTDLLIKSDPALADSLKLRAQNVPWRNGCIAPALAVPGLNDAFCPGFTPDGNKVLTIEQALLAEHGIYPAQKRLEHFQCYGAKSGKRFKRRKVSLADQFVTTKARVLRPVKLCNPAKKNTEPYINKEAHLTCYAIKEPNFKKRGVIARNQFGSERLTVLKPKTLCVPSTKKKLSKRIRNPKLKAKPNLPTDHFKCYSVAAKNKFKARKVTLKDQFGKLRVRVLKPFELCNPVQKNNERIKHPVKHLVCYKIVSTKRKARFKKRNVAVRNQFGRKTLKITRRATLCVPSSKITV